MAKRVLFSLRDVKKVYKMGEVDVHALTGVNLDIYHGELVVVLGPSGSGKSTLLNIMGGMDKATSGEIYFNDELISDFSEERLTDFRRHDVGFVFQFYNLMPALTVLENVELASELSKDALEPATVLEQVGLSDRKSHYPSQISGGEQQRVAIARAIAKNPDVLLCDEPTGALDFQTGLAVLELLKQIHEETGKTVIFITHNRGIAEMADRVIIMRSGNILEIVENPNPKNPSEISW